MSYPDSLRQQAAWVREALDPATPDSQRITLDDIDTDELYASAAHIESLVKALGDLVKACIRYDDEPDSVIAVAAYQSAVAAAALALTRQNGGAGSSDLGASDDH